MIYPNYECYQLCVWMLTISSQRLTGSQITVTQNIQAAALAETGVTENEWNNFNEYAAWRNPYYLVYRDYAIANTTSLLTGLQNYYAFEGNSNDSVGGLNGTDTSISYSTTYGKIGQGARADLTSSQILIGSTSSFSFVQNTAVFSFNFWFKMNNTTQFFIPFASTFTAAQKGIYWQLNNGDWTRICLPNGSGDLRGLYYSLVSNFVSDTNYNMYTFCGDGTYIYLYKNLNLVIRVPAGALSTGNSTNVLSLFRLPAVAGSNQCYMDLLGIWTRCLNFAEISQLYNNGAGLAYPF